MVFANYTSVKIKEKTRVKVGNYLSYYDKAGDAYIEFFEPTKLFCADSF